MGEEGLKLLAKAREEFGMAIITEVMTPGDVGMVCEYADILQIGTRNMQNYFLLDEVGRTQKPVVLKRGMSSTIEEWLLAAEYILSQGNANVILCERGIRTFEKMTRNTLDISAIPVVKKLSHLPIIADPSQGTGHRDLVSAGGRERRIRSRRGLEGRRTIADAAPVQKLDAAGRSSGTGNRAQGGNRMKPVTT